MRGKMESGDVRKRRGGEVEALGLPALGAVEEGAMVRDFPLPMCTE